MSRSDRLHHFRHARVRLRQRYGLVLDVHEYDRLCALVREVAGSFYALKSDGIVYVEIVFYDVPLKLLCNERYVVTALPKDAARPVSGAAA